MAGLRIEAMGWFRVIRDGVAVPLTDWQSKRARDLLKILLSRRGAPVTRDELTTILWPDDPHRSANRLSVVLTTLRSVLERGGVTAIVSDRETVRLDLDAVDVDVERFAIRAAVALDAARRRDPDALDLLQAAEASYGGDFCAEDAYELWAVSLREELASLHLSVLRALSATARSAGETDLEVLSLLALLRQEPYDESAYLDLIRTLQRAGRHGDARRQYQRYVDHMLELELPPQPFPDDLLCRRLTR